VTASYGGLAEGVIRHTARVERQRQRDQGKQSETNTGACDFLDDKLIVVAAEIAARSPPAASG
jgi:hypothetical protein